MDEITFLKELYKDYTVYRRRQWHPLQCSCLENPRDGGAWWAAVCGVSQSQTRLKRLSLAYTVYTVKTLVKIHFTHILMIIY